MDRSPLIEALQHLGALEGVEADLDGNRPDNTVDNGEDDVPTRTAREGMVRVLPARR